MADYAPDFTCRYKAHYKAAGIQHSMQFRFARGGTAVDVQNAGAAACDALTANLEAILPEDFEWLSAEYVLEDSSVWIPSSVLPTAIIGGIVLTALSAVERITSTTFAAKGTAGRTRVSIYCPDYAEDTLNSVGSRGIITAGESVAIGGVTTDLNALATKPYTNGNTPAIWYARATIKRNDHLLKLVRRGLLA